MKQPWIGYIARRFLRTRRREGAISTSLLSIIGIAVGVMALIVVLGVMNGFQLGTIQDILELSSFHVQWKPEHSLQSEIPPESVGDTPHGYVGQPQPEGVIALESFLDKDPRVRHWFAFSDIQALVQGGFSDLQGMVIRGMDPADFWVDDTLQTMITLRPGFPDFSQPGSILLGSELARFLGVRAGDSISVVSISSVDLDIRNPQEVSLKVVGTIESGYYQYDRNFALVSGYTLREYLGWEDPFSLGIKLFDRYQDQSFIRDLSSALGQNPQGLTPFQQDEDPLSESLGGQKELLSWRELNRAIFGALRVEKGIMMFLVSLIFLVVGVNIFQGLRRIIHERSLDIAMFKAIGAGPSQIRRIFFLEGLAIGGIGSAIGTGFGLLVAANINRLITLASSLFGSGLSPQLFYVARIPVELIPHEVVLVASFGFLSAIFAALGASRSVLEINPLQVLGRE